MTCDDVIHPLEVIEMDKLKRALQKDDCFISAFKRSTTIKNE